MVTPKADARSDESLLDAYRGGDEDALGSLLRRHAPAVYRFGLKMCRDPEDANDILQETMLAAARGAREFRGDSSLTTWLYTIARSFCIKARRKARVEAEPLDEDGAMDVPSTAAAPDEAASDHELADALEKAIAELDPMYREVLVLRDVEGLTAPEVGEILGLGVDAVKSRLHRARVSVRDRLAPLMTPAIEGAQTERRAFGSSAAPPPASPSGAPTSVAAIAARGPTCPDVVMQLSRYLEGEIGPDQCKELDAHVASCARCRADCDSLRRVLALCKTESRGGFVSPAIQLAVQRALRQLEARAIPRASDPPRGKGASPRGSRRPKA